MALQNTQSHNQQSTTKGQILNCKSGIKPNICSAVGYPFYNKKTINQTRQDVCPAYFRWMYEDLRPWASTSISLDMVENAKQRAHFRLIIQNGKSFSCLIQLPLLIYFSLLLIKNIGNHNCLLYFAATMVAGSGHDSHLAAKPARCLFYRKTWVGLDFILKASSTQNPIQTAYLKH